MISGCINTNGMLRVKVSRPYSDSTVARILELVENSSENKAKTENFITKFARVYIPGLITCALNGFTDLSPWIGEDGWVYRALSFLVVSCPCALVISVPLSYFGGIGGASRHGIMIKGANYMEELARAQTFVFDKTVPGGAPGNLRGGGELLHPPDSAVHHRRGQKGVPHGDRLRRGGDSRLRSPGAGRRQDCPRWQPPPDGAREYPRACGGFRRDRGTLRG